MRKHAICPICKAQIQVECSNQAPRPILEAHLHYQDGQTWNHSRQIARDSIVILENDNGNEIKRDTAGFADYQCYFEDGGANSEAKVTAGDGESPGQPAFQLRRAASRRKNRHAGIPRNLWKYLD